MQSSGFFLRFWAGGGGISDQLGSEVEVTNINATRLKQDPARQAWTIQIYIDSSNSCLHPHHLC
jgi:hypothetical protein